MSSNNNNTSSIEIDEMPLLLLPELNILPGQSDEEIISSISPYYDFARNKEEFVKNSIKARRNKRFEKGKVGPPRPLNSYFLYMKIMRDRVPRNGNHSKDVSIDFGKCWANEPPKVKEYFKIFARYAKKKHAEIFEGYKFMRKSKRVINHNEENEEQVEDPVDPDFIEQIEDEESPVEQNFMEQMEVEESPAEQNFMVQMEEEFPVEQMETPVEEESQVEQNFIETPVVQNFPVEQNFVETPVVQNFMNLIEFPGNKNNNLPEHVNYVLPEHPLNQMMAADQLPIMKIGNQFYQLTPVQIPDQIEQPPPSALVTLPLDSHISTTPSSMGFAGTQITQMDNAATNTMDFYNPTEKHELELNNNNNNNYNDMYNAAENSANLYNQSLVGTNYHATENVYAANAANLYNQSLVGTNYQATENVYAAMNAANFYDQSLVGTNYQATEAALNAANLYNQSLVGTNYQATENVYAANAANLYNQSLVGTNYQATEAALNAANFYNQS